MYTFVTEFGPDTILAPCLATLCAEIAAHPQYSQLTNLGEIGDTSHQAQGTSSDHNPFVRHNGKGYVRAIDVGGDRALLLQLRSQLFALYQRHDPRVYPYGYFKGPDSLINDWPPGTGWHTDTGDEGHLHISVTQLDGTNPSPTGWMPALDSTDPWGISNQESDVDAATAKQINDKLDKIAARLDSGVAVNGLLDWAHAGHDSIESFLAGVPGYKPLHERMGKAAKPSLAARLLGRGKPKQ